MSVCKVIIVFIFIFACLKSFGQSNDYYNENVKRIDAYINGPIKTYSCEGGITFPTKYNSSKVRSDLRIMSFVNSLFNSKTIKSDVQQRISKVREKKIPIGKSVNGLFESNNITILGKYLWVNVKFDFIDNVIVRSKITMRTTTQGKCGSHTHLLDFKAIRDFFIKDAMMIFNVGYDEMTSDTLYLSSLASLAEKENGYKFNIPGSSAESWINEIFTKQYQTDSADVYDYTKAPKSFLMLVTENKTEVIKDLLFSPNYVTSVNAMEALIYLVSVNKMRLTAELNDRIVQIKNGSFIIMQQGAPDVLYKREGYKQLKMTDERIIMKYSLSM